MFYIEIIRFGVKLVIAIANTCPYLCIHRNDGLDIKHNLFSYDA